MAQAHVPSGKCFPAAEIFGRLDRPENSASIRVLVAGALTVLLDAETAALPHLPASQATEEWSSECLAQGLAPRPEHGFITPGATDVWPRTLLLRGAAALRCFGKAIQRSTISAPSSSVQLAG